MVKVTKSVMIEIEKDGNRITLNQSEFDDIKRQLEAAVREKGREVKVSQKPAKATSS